MLKKIFLGGGVFFIFLFLLLYVIIFTQSGKFFTKPIIQRYIATKYSKDLQLVDFNLFFKSLDIKLKYKDFLDLNILGDYSILEQTFNLNILGKSHSIKKNFILRGELVGSYKNFTIKFLSDIASSQSTLIAQIKDLKATSLYLDSKGIVLEEFLPLFVKNNRLNGKINLLINNHQENNGDFILEILQANFIGKPTHFHFINTILGKRFSGKIDGGLNKNYTILAQGSLDSDIYHLQLQNLKFTLQEISCDYELKIPHQAISTSKEKFDINIKGKATYPYSKDLILSFETQSFEGQINAELQKQILAINFNQNNLKKILSFVKFSQNFDATLYGDLTYSIQQQKGNFEGNIENFHFARNAFFDLIARYTRFKIQQEHFLTMPLFIEFNKNQAIIKDVSLQSQNMGFQTKNIFIDLDKISLNTLLNLRIKKSTINFHLLGNANTIQPKFELSDILRLERK